MNWHLTPDGRRYINMGRGLDEPMPFCLRPLLPMICGDSVPRWIAATVLGLVASVVLTGALTVTRGGTLTQAVLAMVLIAGLPSLRFSFFAPVLVDAPGMAFALAAAVLWPIEAPYSQVIAMGLVVIGALISEKVPIWAAVFGLQPWLLLGLVVPIWVRLVVGKVPTDPRDPLSETIDHPIIASRMHHAGKWRDPKLMLLPWGACLIVIAEPSAWLLIALAVGYAQLLVATDSVRLYQQAAPVVCVLAALSLPTEWALPAVLFHWFNPWMGDGV